MGANDTIGVAIIGSGIFVKEQHLPAVQASPDLELKALYSRSLTSAKSVASSLSDENLYSDDSKQSLSDLLARDDIRAVIIALPIPAQPAYIKQALTAGKHVLAEKPVAKDVATARELIQWYGDKNNVDKKSHPRHRRAVPLLQLLPTGRPARARTRLRPQLPRPNANLHPAGLQVHRNSLAEDPRVPGRVPAGWRRAFHRGLEVLAWE